ncbi:metallophosphoesterase family protein [Maribacter sp. PR1]|uniref:Metallophosphoesterase family protein n=1 Tax=Maribacter cobaltidurans TaxID=1178778 RepID=A0ABU7IXD2_9FLAO|nr:MULTISPECIES: metallophosphoesterase family protein [Maribacter]MDC6389786.1 metallophosphoesterase family protein [Maribacter sp. PR1]MEE1977176.1 metallophosphoesterase family protein [Maribacter cobaltidurans]
MKIGIISDIHGNYEALKMVLAHLDQLNISKVYCLGDVVGYYSQVNECCNALIERNIPTLMGNHDWYMVSGGFCTRSEHVNKCLEYQRRVITKENLKWLGSNQLQFVLNDLHMVHGGWSDPIDEYLFNPSQEYFSTIEGKTFISGHTHIQKLEIYKEKVYCNPGSVGQPRDKNPKSAFAIYDQGEISLHRVAYDIDKVNELMKMAGFNDSNYSSLKKNDRFYAGFHIS